MIFLDGDSLTLEQVVAVADDGAEVGLAPAAVQRIENARAAIDRDAAGDDPVYGVNTGFGALAETAIPRDELAALQLNLIRSHSAGVGDPLPVRAVRASMLLRANVLAKGFSGIRRSTLEHLIAMVNRRVHPRVPSRGSVGASGDLAPLAHLALVLVGEGEATVGDDPSIRTGARGVVESRVETDRARAEGRAGAHQRHAAVRGGRALDAHRRRTARSGRGHHRRRSRSTGCAARRARSIRGFTTRGPIPDR